MNILGYLMPPWVKWVAIGLLVTALLGAAWKVISYVQGAEEAKAAVATLTKERDEAQTAAALNAKATDDCLLVNAENALEATRQMFKAREAEIRLAALNAEAGKDVERIRRDESTFRARGADCPAIDQPFRDWVRGSP